MKPTKTMNKKGILQDLNTLLISLATIAIVLTVTFLIMAEGAKQATNIEGAANYSECTSYACNSTKTTQNAMQTVPDWLSIIVIVVIGAIILGLIQIFRRR